MVYKVDRENLCIGGDSGSPLMGCPNPQSLVFLAQGFGYCYCSSLCYLFSSLRAVDVVQMLPLATSITILQQCAAGMHHLHSLGIIHRDFRAANILVAGTVPLHVVVADFGVSHQLRVYAQVCEP